MTVVGGTTQALTGTRTAVVILLNFSNANLSFSAGEVSPLLFGTGATVDSVYREASFGAVGWSGNVVGPFTMNNYTNAGCDYNGWATAGDQLAQAAGINLSAYQHRTYVVPSAGCGWAGLGNLGCSGTSCRTWVSGYGTSPGVYAHEWGHNLGWNHSSDNTGSEYGDYSDIMGFGCWSWATTFNAPKKIQMAWMPNPQTVSTGAYTISSTARTGPSSIRVAIPGSSNAYIVSYRTQDGFDAALSSSYAPKTNIHLWAGGSSYSYFQKALADGESFSDSNGIIITQTTSGSGTASVSISQECAHKAPTVVFSPASKVGAPGSTQSYSAQITNQDIGGCQSSDFSLVASGSANLSISLSAGALTLAPGASASVTANVTSAASSADGTYSFSLQATGNGSTAQIGSGSATYIIDFAPPTTPQNLTATSTRKRKVTLSWQASTDSGGIASYEVWRNGAKLSSVTTPGYTDGSVKSGTQYTYTVRAVDRTGNVSAFSNPASVTAR